MAKEIQGDFLKILVLSKVKELLNNTQKHKIILTDGWRIFVNSSITLLYLKCSQCTPFAWLKVC